MDLNDIIILSDAVSKSHSEIGFHSRVFFTGNDILNSRVEFYFNILRMEQVIYYGFKFSDQGSI